MTPEVRLDDLDDEALSLLVVLALPDTDAGEVMPTDPGAATWTPQRVGEFIAFHHGRRGGLYGLVGEVSFIGVVDDVASGVLRLQRAEAGSLEVGMWLTRSARGRGIGARVLAEAARKAVADVVSPVHETRRANLVADRRFWWHAAAGD